MGWRCRKCGASDPSDDLTFPMTHDLRSPGCTPDDVEAGNATALRWGALLG